MPPAMATQFTPLEAETENLPMDLFASEDDQTESVELKAGNSRKASGTSDASKTQSGLIGT